MNKIIIVLIALSLLIGGCTTKTIIVPLPEEITTHCYIECDTIISYLNCEDAQDLDNETLEAMTKDNCIVHNNLMVKQGVRLI